MADMEHLKCAQLRLGEAGLKPDWNGFWLGTSTV